ncbi:TPA: DNA polymerase III subunit beta [Burkholderia vietnamiensis]|nr:DNA polymerase III subunit beta [Burkholderia vietnamiensis]
MQTIHFTVAQLKAAQILAAQQDIRYYLNGVFIEATPFETRLVATDGHKAGVFRYAVENDVLAGATVENDVLAGATVEVIIPHEAIDRLKAAKSDMTAVVRLEVEDRQCSLCVDAMGARIQFVAVDGRYPDYRRIFPKTMSGVPGQYRADLLMDFAKAAKLLIKKSPAVMPRLTYDGSCARVSFDDYDDFAGVVMGWQIPAKSKTRPADTSWI